MSDFKVNRSTPSFSPLNPTNNVDGFRLNIPLVRSNRSTTAGNPNFAIYELPAYLTENQP